MLLPSPFVLHILLMLAQEGDASLLAEHYISKKLPQPLLSEMEKQCYGYRLEASVTKKLYADTEDIDILLYLNILFSFCQIPEIDNDASPHTCE